jgi:hypothetical protein
METKSKIINDINAVERFRKLLTVGYTIPTSVGAVVFLINYIISAAKISSPVFPILFSIIFFPPAIFTPYILYVLFKEKRFGWIITYFVMVIIPGVIAITVLGFAYGLIILILFAPFYFFCFLIKFSVDEWIREYNWEQQLIQQRNEEEERKRNEGLL